MKKNKKVPIIVICSVPDVCVGIFEVDKKGKISKTITVHHTHAATKTFEIEGVIIPYNIDYVYVQYDYTKPRDIMIRARKVGVLPFEVTSKITARGLIVNAYMDKDLAFYNKDRNIV